VAPGFSVHSFSGAVRLDRRRIAEGLCCPGGYAFCAGCFGGEDAAGIGGGRLGRRLLPADSARARARLPFLVALQAAVHLVERAGGTSAGDRPISDALPASGDRHHHHNGASFRHAGVATGKPVSLSSHTPGSGPGRALYCGRLFSRRMDLAVPAFRGCRAAVADHGQKTEGAWSCGSFRRPAWALPGNVFDSGAVCLSLSHSRSKFQVCLTGAWPDPDRLWDDRPGGKAVFAFSRESRREDLGNCRRRRPGSPAGFLQRWERPSGKPESLGQSTLGGRPLRFRRYSARRGAFRRPPDGHGQSAAFLEAGRSCFRRGLSAPVRALLHGDLTTASPFLLRLLRHRYRHVEAVREGDGGTVHAGAGRGFRQAIRAGAVLL
jgi:hypothetical protein